MKTRFARPRGGLERAVLHTLWDGKASDRRGECGESGRVRNAADNLPTYRRQQDGTPGAPIQQLPAPGTTNCLTGRQESAPIIIIIIIIIADIHSGRPVSEPSQSRDHLS